MACSIRRRSPHLAVGSNHVAQSSNERTVGAAGALSFTVARLFVVALLLGSVGDHPYAYYEVLRVATCAVAAFGVWWAAREEAGGWVWLLVTIGVIFNPLIPVRLGRAAWIVIDLGTAVVLLVSLLALPRRRTPALYTTGVGVVVGDSAGVGVDQRTASHSTLDHRADMTRADATRTSAPHPGQPFPSAAHESVAEYGNESELDTAADQDDDPSVRGPWDCPECGLRNRNCHFQCSRCGYQLRD